MTYVRIVLVASLMLASASCDRPGKPEADQAQTQAGALIQKQVEPVPMLALNEDQLTALAFRAAWDGPPPIERDEKTGGQTERRTYRSGKLIPLHDGQFALVSEGQGGEGHVSAGSLSIHYLRRTPAGFERTGSWPSILVTGTWGSPPEWTIRNDLMPFPTLVAEGGGTWQGTTCTWAHLVELIPERPMVRVNQIGLSYGDGGAREEGAETSMEGVIMPGERGRTIRVRYTGDVDATVTYAKVGDVYDPVNLPDLPGC